MRTLWSDAYLFKHLFTSKRTFWFHRREERGGKIVLLHSLFIKKFQFNNSIFFLIVRLMHVYYKESKTFGQLLFSLSLSTHTHTSTYNTCKNEMLFFIVSFKLAFHLTIYCHHLNIQVYFNYFIVWVYCNLSFRHEGILWLFAFLFSIIDNIIINLHSHIFLQMLLKLNQQIFLYSR